MHPEKGCSDQDEEQHETTRPDADQVVECAEGDGQYEAAQPANHADHTADGTNTIGIIDWDMFVDGGFSKGHEESKDENEYGEWPDIHAEREFNRAFDAFNDVVR